MGGVIEPKRMRRDRVVAFILIGAGTRSARRPKIDGRPANYLMPAR